MKRILSYLALIVLAALGSRAQFAEPDFAFPATVAGDARAALQRAETLAPDSASAVRLRALLELTVAASSIDPDSIFAIPYIIEQQRLKSNNSEAGRAMLTALQAAVLTRIYRSHSWKYNRVEVAEGAAPADISLWGRANFEREATALIDSSMAIDAAAPLSAFSGAVEGSASALQYVGTAANFIRSVAVGIAEVFDESDRVQTLINQGLSDAEPDSDGYFYWLYQRDKGNPSALLADYRANEREDAARIFLWGYLQNGGADYVSPVSRPRSEASDFATLSEQRLRTVRLIEESLDRFPNWVDNALLRQQHFELTTPSVSVVSELLTAVGAEMKLTVNYWYADTLEISVFEGVTGGVASFQPEQQPVADFTVVPTQVYGTKTLTFTPNSAASYLIVPAVNGHRSDASSSFTATPIYPVNISNGNHNTLIVTDFTTGEPRKGVKVSLNSEDFRTAALNREALGKSNRHGLLDFTSRRGDRSRQWLTFAVDGTELNFDRNIAVWYAGSSSSNASTRAAFITDRALYHPGDTLRWMAIVTETNGPDGRVLADKTVQVRLLDANRQTVSEQDFKSDASGRIYGDFAIPEGLLAGNFSLIAKADGGSIGSTAVTVSDFKLPTIYIECQGIERNIPSEGAVTLRGIVKTYSGVPVGGADVVADLSRAMRRWCRFYGVEQLGQVSGTTSADGTFSIAVPAEKLAGNPGESDFIANFTATTVNAETATSTCNFATGKQLALTVKELGNVDAAREASMVISAFNPEGANEAIALRWQLGVPDTLGTGLQSIVLQGEAVAGERVALRLADVPAGVYALRVEPVDTLLADNLFLPAFATVYNTAANAVPATGEPFFAPFEQLPRSGRKVQLTLGTSLSQATVYVAVGVGDEIVSVKPYTLSRGFRTIIVDVPENNRSTACLTLVGVRDGRQYSKRIEVTQPAEPELRITAESFRDRLMPGSVETWRLHIALGEAAADAAMVASMYNGALDALTHYSMPTGFGLHRRATWLNLRGPLTGNRQCSATLLRSYDGAAPAAWSWPEWRFLGLISSRYATEMSLYSNSLQIRGKAEVVEDASAVESVADSLTGTAEVESAEAEGESAEADENQDFEYRDGEVLQAFFMPALTTDAEGNVELTFTVPNANGTWALRTFAWTAALKAANFDASAIAAKPVMAVPNLPRFLRSGDRASLGATLYNNTDAEAAVSATVEIFDPATGAVRRTERFERTVAAQGSTVVYVEVEAANEAAVGYRVRCSNGAYTDGEQDAIPVLPSEATVVESIDFYLNAEQTPLVLYIPVRPATQYTLEYVSNPVWTVVKAMRGLDAGGSSTSTGLASRLYSALTAKKIAAELPTVREAYAQWAANPSEEALTSMLSRNADLKTLLLDQTPWVQASATESDRMAQLARIFDSAEVARTIAAATERLGRARGASGGLSWLCGGSEVSPWATRSVLLTLGRANEQNMLSDDNADLKDLCRSAFEYVCLQLDRVDTDVEFATICTLWPEFEPVGKGADVLAATLDYLSRKWRRLDTPAKANAVYLLKANGRSDVAAQAFESLRQFGVVRAGQGLTFPSVNSIRDYYALIRAYVAMEAPRADLDAMRQWVTLQAQATDDLGAGNPDALISSVLLTGSDWTAAPRAFGLSVDGMPLHASAQELATGYTAFRLEPSGEHLHIEITPNGATPSYGAVVSVGDRPQASVEPASCRDLSVTKKFLVLRDGSWVETNDFALGERVRVQLVLTASRALEYVAVTDNRAATFQPVDQLPGYVREGTLSAYRENADAATNLFIAYLPAGVWHLTYDMTASNAGTFSSGVATAQSQYAPALTAHSGGCFVTVR